MTWTSEAPQVTSEDATQPSSDLARETPSPIATGIDMNLVLTSRSANA